MRYLLAPVALLLAFGSHAQDLHADGTKGIFVPPTYDNLQAQKLGDTKYGTPTKSAVPTPANGAVLRPNEYLFTTWSLGTLQPYNGPARRAWLMYNAVSRQLVERVMQRKSATSQVVDMGLLREFVVGDSARNLRVTYRRYLDTRVAKPSLRTAFYEVHYDAGRTALLCQRTHNPGLPSVNMSGFTGGNDVLRYFIKNTANQILPIALKSSEIITALGPAHAGELKSYAQAQHLNFKLERDIVQLLAYHDSL